MYIFKTCAAICENFVRDLLTFIHSNWKRTIRHRSFSGKIFSKFFQFSQYSFNILCPNFGRGEILSFLGGCGAKRREAKPPPPKKTLNFAPGPSARAKKWNPGFHKVLIAGVFFQKSPGHLLKKPSPFTDFFLNLLFSPIFSLFFPSFFPEIRTINFFSSNSLVFSFFVCLFVKLDTHLLKKPSPFTHFF